jgi:hypothetical protein
MDKQRCALIQFCYIRLKYEWTSESVVHLICTILNYMIILCYCIKFWNGFPEDLREY